MTGIARVLAAGLLAAGAAAPVAAADPALEKDLALFLDWLPGRYDNELQTFFEPDLGVAEAERHERVHAVFRRVDLPAFGAPAFYVEHYRGGDPAKISRQRIYVASADETEKAIRLRMFAPKSPGRIAGAWRDVAKLKGLKPSDATTIAGCDVLWRREANQFRGRVADGACRVPAAGAEGDLVVDDDLILAPNEVWMSTRAATPDGGYGSGNRAGVPDKLKKVRAFECWTAVLRGARHGDSGEGLDDWDFRRGGLIHDQAGVLALATDETPPRDIRLKLRRVEWPSGPNRPSLTLYVHEGAATRALSYAWAEADAERIGINLRWLQASCTHAPERIWEAP